MPNELGAGTATSEVAIGYSGKCEVKEKYSDKTIAVLPNSIEAEKVAGYACTPDGGFGSIIVTASKEKDALTHNSYEEWMSS